MTVTIAPASPAQAAPLARIHAECLPDDFLPSLGTDFLEHRYYPAALTSPNAVTLVATEGTRPVGFATVANDSDALSRDVLRGRLASIAGYALLRALRQPSHLLTSAQVLAAALRPRPSQCPGEIVFIAVLPPHRGRGVGRRLVEASLAYLRQRSVPRCRTKTLAGNAGVIRLYENMGWRVVDRYRLIGREYVVLLSPAGDAPPGVAEGGTSC